VFVTWRLAGTLPQVPGEVLRRDPHPGRSFRVQDRRLDSTPHGPRWLQEARVATVVAEALAYGEKIRGAYSLLAWVHHAQPRSPGVAASGQAIGHPAMVEDRYRDAGQPPPGEDRGGLLAERVFRSLGEVREGAGRRW